ncbi:hypothetical protein [Natronorubrum sp. A-ect3]|uniref:hypothetical protein n=1 Tax=Natronorubrum sp. A-ect3 TaxID=3242698 RepID=UPI00359CBFCD
MPNYNPTHDEPNEADDPPVHIYDSRENCVRSPADGSELQVERITAVSRLFASEAPVAFDGEWVYLSVRVSDGTSRSQTCYAVVEATAIDSVADLEKHVSSALAGTELQLGSADRDQLAYVCLFLDRYDDVTPPDEFDLLVSRSETTRCGVPSYEVALAALERALSAGEPLVVCRQTTSLDDDVDAPLGAKNVVVVDESFESPVWSESTDELIDQLRTTRRKRQIDEAIQPVDDVVSDLRQFGLDDEAIREQVSDRLPDAENEMDSSLWRCLLPFGGARDGRSADDNPKECVRPLDSDSADNSSSTSSRQGAATNGDTAASARSDANRRDRSESLVETFSGDSDLPRSYSSDRIKPIVLALVLGGFIAGTAGVLLILSQGYGPEIRELIPTTGPSLPSVTPPIALLTLTVLATVLFIGIVLTKR